jgi:hypothetical protein
MEFFLRCAPDRFIPSAVSHSLLSAGSIFALSSCALTALRLCSLDSRSVFHSIGRSLGAGVAWCQAGLLHSSVLILVLQQDTAPGFSTTVCITRSDKTQSLVPFVFRFCVGSLQEEAGVILELPDKKTCGFLVQIALPR